MKYFSIETVVNAYKGFQDCMTNKSWGYLAILRGCKSSIRPSVPFEVDMDMVSNFLENIFNLSQTKKKYESGRSLYVVFSNKWNHYFNYQGKYSPNLFDIIVWAYRRKAFHDDITKEKLFQLFSEEFNIPIGGISDCFNIGPKEVLFVNTLYSESDLKAKLNQIGVNVSSNNIDAKKASYVASPGEISRGPFVQTLYAGLDITDYVLILQSDFYSLYGERKDISNNNNEDTKNLQQIFYGAPGTGKSHIIKEQTKGEDVIRTTFHPDTDYSTFVGTYKPTTEFAPVLAIIGDKAVDTGREEKRISYEFVCQPFLQAYVAAWKKVAEAKGSTAKKQFLVIEEINRGNCAQIFGDLFQLLDRNDFGYSDYPIKADADMQKQLKRLFEGVTITDADSINAMYDGRDIVKEVLSGEVLLLPNNLYIWATMNTSDQSLFPIDSAFKRRWDWQYMPISDGGKQWVIEIGSQKYSWWSFIQKINNEIYEKTNSEDKKLGYYFCKPINGVIKVETFVSKVLFYLWNDVFKDFEEDNGLFVESYDKFYTEGQNGMPLVIKEKVVLFMQKLGVEEIGLSESMVEEEHLLDEDGNSSTLANNRNFDYSKYSVNGEGAYPKGAVAQQAIKQFVLMNPDMSANDVIRTWLSLNVKVPNFIETIQMYNERTAGSSDSVLRTRYKTVEMPNGETLYVSNQYNVERINDLISKVNAQPWGIHIEKVSIGN